MLIQMPESEYDRKVKRIESWIDTSKVTAFQGFADGTVTITFDNGMNMKFGPYEDVYEEIVDNLLEGRRS